MFSYCLKCKNKTESVVMTKNGKIMLLPNCVVCNSSKSRLVKEQEASVWKSSLGIKAPLRKIPLVGPLLF